MHARTTLPPQEVFMYAILKHLAAHPNGDNRQLIHEAMPDLVGLSESQRNERLRNMPQLRYRHRSGFGLSMLKKGGFVSNDGSGLWWITEEGKRLLTKFPDGFSSPEAKKLLSSARQRNDPEQLEGDVANSDFQQSPDERIDSAVSELSAQVAFDLLDRILNAPPAFFEQLVLDLLHAMGYGNTDDDLQRVGGSGDGGIDGVISLDALGFEKVYVQAKRWKGSIGRPEIQTFLGALAGKRTGKGVFITTSSFTREASDFGHQMNDSVVLIDGPRLTTLMIKYGVGVTHYRTIRLPSIDADYFDPD